MKMIATVALAIFVCTYAARHDTIDSNENGGVVTGQMLSKLVNIVLGFVDVGKLGISLQQFSCVKTDEVVSEIYGGRVLQLNSNIVDVECSTHHIHVANPPHSDQDEAFRSETLFEVDNLSLRLQCDLDVFTEYIKFVGGSKIGNMFWTTDEEPVWTGRPLCDIKKVNIENPQVFVETLNRGLVRRNQSNVDGFLEKVKETFGGQEAPEEVEQATPQEATSQEASALITWTSMQNPVTKASSSCLDNPYTQMGEFVKHEGLCGFVLPRLELYVDGATVVWKQAHTKAVAKLMSLSKRFTLAKILGYIIKYAGILAGSTGKVINAIVEGMSSIGHQLNRLNPLSKK